jgi:hypothetical protein
VNFNSYYVEQWAKQVQTQKRAEARSYNIWSRARKALRNTDASRKVR